MLEHCKDINTKWFLPELLFVTAWLSTLQINSAMPCRKNVRGQGRTVSYILRYRERSGPITAPRIGGKCPLNVVVKRGMCLTKITSQVSSPLPSHYNDTHTHTHTPGVQLPLHSLNSESPVSQVSDINKQLLSFMKFKWNISTSVLRYKYKG